MSCSLPPDEILKSDQRRKQIDKLFDRSGDMQRMTDQPEQSLETYGQLMQLLLEEYAGGS